MIVIAGTVTIRPGKRDAAIRVAQTMVKATQAEPGCVRYQFYADLDDPHTFFLFEEWGSEEALARHFASEHMKNVTAMVMMPCVFSFCGNCRMNTPSTNTTSVTTSKSHHRSVNAGWP